MGDYGMGYFGICDGVLGWTGMCNTPINVLGLNVMNNDTLGTLHPKISGVWRADISIPRGYKTIGIGINYITRVFYIIDDGEKVYNIPIPKDIDIDKMVYFYQESGWNSFSGQNIWNFGTAPFIYNNPTIIAHWICTQNNNIYGIPS